MITSHHVRRRRSAVHINNLAEPPASDPAYDLLAAVFRRAHQDARSRSPELREPATAWLSEMQAMLLPALEGRRYDTN